MGEIKIPFSSIRCGHCGETPKNPQGIPKTNRWECEFCGGVNEIYIFEAGTELKEENP